jgi:uncharacterized protein YabN with tetrapyrrole methylase and pyrophosphatase domain
MGVRGSLTVIGTGMHWSHVTRQALSAIESAQEVFFLCADPVTPTLIHALNPSSGTIYDLYEPGKDRKATYVGMIDRILDAVRSGRDICAAFYGHPGVYCYPAHCAIATARAEGYPAVMLPGVSSIDCLYADLGVDPADGGCQIFEATEFLLYKKKFDTSAALILLQSSVIGERTYNPQAAGGWGLAILQEYLLEFYDGTHEIFVYNASKIAFFESTVQRITLSELTSMTGRLTGTLYLPPKSGRLADPEMTMRLYETGSSVI